MTKIQTVEYMCDRCKTISKSFAFVDLPEPCQIHLGRVTTGELRMAIGGFDVHLCRGCAELLGETEFIKGWKP